jgi:hypothetical protein
MPHAYTIDETLSLVRVSGWGEVSFETYFGTLRRAFADPRYRPGFDVLYDRTGLDDIPDARRVRAWVETMAPVMRDARAGRLAVVVTMPVVYGMMRMAGAFADQLGYQLAPYWCEAEALEALGRAGPN